MRLWLNAALAAWLAVNENTVCGTSLGIRGIRRRPSMAHSAELFGPLNLGRIKQSCFNQNKILRFRRLTIGLINPKNALQHGPISWLCLQPNSVLMITILPLLGKRQMSALAL